MKYTKYFLIIVLLTAFGFYGCSKDSTQEHSEETKADLYYCPMHPQVTSDKPGVCPICHMDLVKKADNENMATEEMKGMLTLTERGLVLANVSTTKVMKEKIVKQIDAFGILDFAEPNRKLITARFNGRIEKLFVDATGTYVQKGQPLFEIYSPDLVQAQNEFLIAFGSNKTAFYASLENSGANGSEQLLNSSRKKLQLFGITQKQIEELERTGEVQLTLTYYSPYSGTVIEKKVQEGMYVNEGSVIYDIADLSTLWNISEIFSDDIGMIKAGDRIQLKTSSYPGEIFSGKITFIYPVINPESRTVKVRSEFRNITGKLKPQMFTESIFEKNYGESLTIPAEAVLFTGKKNVVWVKAGAPANSTNGMFEARDVMLGVKSNGKYQILSGLKEGEEIASAGGFLIDSESQLQSGNVQGHQHGSESPDDQPLKNKNMQENNPEMEKPNEHEGHSSLDEQKIFNEVCPVLGNLVSSNVKPVEYKGKLYGFCCAGCDQKFIADPEKYIKNLSNDGTSFLAKK